MDTYKLLVKAYPTPAALAKATFADLESRIRHLGLSRKRAVHLKGLGQTLSDRDIQSLSDPTESIHFPGLGAYGARAVACFAFGRQTGIVDANVRRVITRIFDLPKWEYRSVRFQHVADKLVATGDSAAVVNFGLLDLGATVCVRSPRCDLCPIARVCAYAKKRQSEAL